MRPIAFFALALALLPLSGCGYHTLGAATHLPPGVSTLAVPLFATRTEAYRTETVMTQAVIREFATRTRLRVTPDANGDPDAILHGTILKEVVSPLTYNSTTQQSSSYLITMVVSVTLNARDGKILYENKNYVFRQQYQSTTNLSSFFEEDPAAVERLSREFARQLVADVLEGFSAARDYSHNEKRRKTGLPPPGAEHQVIGIYRADAGGKVPAGSRRICRFVTVVRGGKHAVGGAVQIAVEGGSNGFVP
jgi:outer membrane lipopolysaccharide assembly protein LptE/RlpB